MEVGQLNNIRVAYIIQARMRSIRLPGKILMNIPVNGNKSLLKWITDALKESKFQNEIIVATSTNPENNVLESYAKEEGLNIYRGDEENVLSRFIEIVKHNQFDVVVRLTADNPIIDLEILEESILNHYKNKVDYTKTEGLPIGMNFEIINPRILLSLEYEKLSKEDFEHVTLFTRNNSHNKLVLKFGSNELGKLRLTIDYPNDYATVSLLLSQLKNNEKPNLNWISNKYMTQNWIFEINQNNFQKKQYSSLTEEIKDAIAFLEMNDFKWTAKKLKQID